MWINERRRHQVAANVDDLARLGVDRRRNRRDPPVADANVGNCPVRQHAALEQGVKTHLSPFW
jgi:hypothetical protein